jgi:hypothetical protein
MHSNDLLVPVNSLPEHAISIINAGNKASTGKQIQQNKPPIAEWL